MTIQTQSERNSNAIQTQLCPACHSTNTETAHLISEYQILYRAESGMFGKNAGHARIEVAQLLLDRNVTHMPNIFGPIEISNTKSGVGTKS